LENADPVEALKKLLEKLMQFAMVLGGFGKSWRRADHRLFFEDYYENDRYKALIGCHWQWGGGECVAAGCAGAIAGEVGGFYRQGTAGGTGLDAASGGGC
jgi:CRISPR-associated protein Cmr6